MKFNTLLLRGGGAAAASPYNYKWQIGSAELLLSELRRCCTGTIGSGSPPVVSASLEEAPENITENCPRVD